MDPCAFAKIELNVLRSGGANALLLSQLRAPNPRQAKAQAIADHSSGRGDARARRVISASRDACRPCPEQSIAFRSIRFPAFAVARGMTIGPPPLGHACTTTRIRGHIWSGPSMSITRVRMEAAQESDMGNFVIRLGDCDIIFPRSRGGGSHAKSRYGMQDRQ